MPNDQLNKCYHCDRTDTFPIAISCCLLGRFYGFCYLCPDHNPYRITPDKENGIFYSKKRYYDKRLGIYYDKRRTSRKAAEKAQQENANTTPPSCEISHKPDEG